MVILSAKGGGRFAWGVGIKGGGKGHSAYGETIKREKEQSKSCPVRWGGGLGGGGGGGGAES